MFREVIKKKYPIGDDVINTMTTVIDTTIGVKHEWTKAVQVNCKHILVIFSLLRFFFLAACLIILVHSSNNIKITFSRFVTSEI